MSLYSANVRYDYKGQQMQIGFQYRDTSPLPVGLDARTACIQLGEAVRDNLVAAVVGQSRLADLVAKDVNFTAVSVNRIDANTWLPELLAPVEVDMGFTSWTSSPAADSPATVAILRVSGGIRSLSPLDYEPKRGYKCIGPVPGSYSLPDGTLTNSYMSSLDDFGAAVSAVLDMGAGFTATPVIFGKRNILGAVQRGFADIVDTSPKSTLSWRRSRQPR